MGTSGNYSLDTQGVTGARLVFDLSTEERLATIGINEAGDRTALLQMVDDVVKKDATALMRRLEVAEHSKVDPEWAKRRLVGLSPPARPAVAGAQLISVTSDGAFQLVRPVELTKCQGPRWLIHLALRHHAISPQMCKRLVTDALLERHGAGWQMPGGASLYVAQGCVKCTLQRRK